MLSSMFHTDGASIALDAIKPVERVGMLPPALVLAGSFIARTAVSKYLELYTQS